MSRERKLIFLGVVGALLIVPSILPYLIGGVVLPWWALALYAGLVLVNASVYLVFRCVLIDRFLVPGRKWAFLGWALLVFVAACLVQLSTLDGSARAHIDADITVGDFLGFGVVLSQKAMAVMLALFSALTALAVSFSDQWRRAAFRYHQAERDNQALSADLDQLKGEMDALKRPAAQPESISVKIDLVMTQIPLEDILYIKSDGDYIVLHLSDGRAPMVLMTLKAMEKQLPFDRFCRIHRSYLVNLSKVQGMRGGKIRVGAEELPLSDSCKAAFFELLSHKSIVLKTE